MTIPSVSWNAERRFQPYDYALKVDLGFFAECRQDGDICGAPNFDEMELLHTLRRFDNAPADRVVRA